LIVSRGGYTRKNLESFIDSVVMGRQTGEPLPEQMRFPKVHIARSKYPLLVILQLTAWDGKDSAPLGKKEEEEEEDFRIDEETSAKEKTGREAPKRGSRTKPKGDEL
jgi:hypothetical protein